MWPLLGQVRLLELLDGRAEQLERLMVRALAPRQADVVRQLVDEQVDASHGAALIDAGDSLSELVVQMLRPNE